MKLLIILWAVALNAWAGGATIETGASSYSSSGRQNVTFNQPGTQAIITVPGLGAQYTPPASECYPNWGAQAVGLGNGAGATFPIYSLPCHWREQSKTLGSLGVANVNAGNPQKGLEALEDSVDLLYGTDVNLYLLAKAKGRQPPLRPDRGVLDAFPGGMVDQHVEPVPGYAPAPPPQPVVQNAPPVHTHPEYDRKLDQAHRIWNMK